MMDMLLLLIPAAGVVGWYYGRQHFHEESAQRPLELSRDYFVGLNHLLDEQPDKAVDVFVKMLEIDSDTVETHLALGNLFRRRGEISRAIRIHQNLIARPQLSKEHRIQALLALGQDYLRAGLLDRAERLFLEVVETGSYLSISMNYLLDIYQQQRRWEQAVVIANKLEAATGESMRIRVSHYCCELAIKAREQHHYEDAFTHLKNALAVDSHCVRASILLGEIHFDLEQYQIAIDAYQQVRNQNAEYLSEIIAPLVSCYHHLHQQEKLHAYLQQSLKECSRISIVIALTDYLQEKQGTDAAVEFISEQLKQHPSLRGLKRLIELQICSAEGKVKEYLNMLQKLTMNLIKIRPVYRCIHCGFHGRLLHWQCPGCKGWGTVRPVHGLEGD